MVSSVVLPPDMTVQQMVARSYVLAYVSWQACYVSRVDNHDHVKPLEYAIPCSTNVICSNWGAITWDRFNLFFNMFLHLARSIHFLAKQMIYTIYDSKRFNVLHYVSPLQLGDPNIISTCWDVLKISGTAVGQEEPSYPYPGQECHWIPRAVFLMRQQHSQLQQGLSGYHVPDREANVKLIWRDHEALRAVYDSRYKKRHRPLRKRRNSSFVDSNHRFHDTRSPKYCKIHCKVAWNWILLQLRWCKCVCVCVCEV